MDEGRIGRGEERVIEVKRRGTLPTTDKGRWRFNEALVREHEKNEK